jgi:hypothetical protein
MILLSILLACVQPAHLQYDHGQALRAAMAAQADRTRVTAADGVFPLSGVEAEALRLNVSTATGDAEDIDSEALGQ